MPRQPSLALSLLLLLSVTACDGGPLLAVDVRSDLAPGVEVETLRVELSTETHVRVEEIHVSANDPLFSGVRVATFDDIALGSHRLRVSALDADGVTVLSRPLVLDVDRSFGVTVLLTRDCRDVSCGDESACFAAQCVDPHCVAGDPSCGAPSCTSDSECAYEAACAVGRCIDGACLAMDDRSCGASMACDPDVGCVAVTSGPPSDGGAPSDGSTTGTDGGVDAGRSCEMTLPDEITADLTLPAGCLVHMVESVWVTNEAFLTVEAGVRIEAAAGTTLSVGQPGADSGIEVRGTAEAPVVFTTAATRPSPGQWAGLELGYSLLGPSVFEHAIFEYGGASDAVLALDSRMTPGVLAITDCRFRENATGAIHMQEGEGSPRSFAALSRNTFERNGPDDVIMSAAALGALDATNVLSSAIRLEGPYISESVVWGPFDVPVIAPDGIDISGAEGQLLVTDTHIRVGAGESIGVWGGSLVATRVTFSSALVAPGAGAWCDVHVSSPGSMRLEDSIIRHAGCAAGPNDATLYVSEYALTRTTVTGTTFESSGGVRNVVVDGGALGDCARFTSAAAANTFDLFPCGL